jgi:Kef-type K+ transport system membrane component KefB
VFGLKPITGLFLGAILSITSTAIVAKILSEKNFSDRPEVPLLIAALIVEDIISIVLLAILSGLGHGTEEVSLKFIFSVANSLLIFGGFYLIISKLLKIVLDWLSNNRAEETLAFSALSMGVGLSFLAQLAGLPASIGAFLAGNLIASLKQADEFKQAIYPLIFVFSALFFLSVGMTVDLSSIIASWWLILGIAIAAIVIKFVAMHVSFYFVEGDSRSATFAGLAMLSIGEFSLLIAQLSHGIVTEIDLVGITSALVLITTIASSVLIDSSEEVWWKIRRIVPVRIVDAGKRIAQQNQQAFSAIQYNYSLSGKVGSSLSFVREHVLTMAIIIGVIIYSTQTAQTVIIGGSLVSVRGLGLSVALIATAAITARTALAMRKNALYSRHTVDAFALYRKLGYAITTSAMIWVAIALIMVFVIFELDPQATRMIALIAILIVIADIYLQGKQSRRGMFLR